MRHLQNAGWMSGNPVLSPFSGWNEVHGGSMDLHMGLTIAAPEGMPSGTGRGDFLRFCLHNKERE